MTTLCFSFSDSHDTTLRSVFWAFYIKAKQTLAGIQEDHGSSVILSEHEK